jgi:DNA-binding PadR family transcriptional regulator
MFDLTGFQHDLPYGVNGHEKPNGLTLKEDLEGYYEKEIHNGRLYPNLDTLVEKDLVEKGEADRRTNYCMLTKRSQWVIEGRRDWEDNYA